MKYSSRTILLGATLLSLALPGQVQAVTRFYLPSTGASPLGALAADAAWEDVSILTRNKLITAKISSAFATDSFLDNNAVSRDVLFRQYVSDPIAAQTISAQTLEFQIRGALTSQGDAMFTTIGVRVVSGDGATVRGTVLPVTRDATVLTATLTNRRITDTTTQVVAQSGDRIVVEIGTGGDPSGTLDHDSDLRVGDASASDLPEDDASTADDNPWVEFPNTITFLTAPTVSTQSASGVGQTSATLNGTIEATGGANATVRGFAWGTSPTMNGDTATTSDTAGQPFGTGTFTESSLTLVCNTTYYSRAYATNSGGTGYGGISASFTTSACGGGGDAPPPRVMRLFEGMRIKFTSGRIILYQR